MTIKEYFNKKMFFDVKRSTTVDQEQWSLLRPVDPLNEMK